MSAVKKAVTFLLNPKQYDEFLKKYFPKVAEDIGTASSGIVNNVNAALTYDKYKEEDFKYVYKNNEITLADVQKINSIIDTEAFRAGAREGNNSKYWASSQKLGKASGVLGLVQVTVNMSTRLGDNNEFTGAISDSDVGEFLTATAGLLAIAGAPFTAAIALTGGLIYAIYNLTTQDHITFEELIYGYNHDILWAFVNNPVTQQHERNIYEDLILGVGADSIAKWMMESYGSKKAQELIQDTTYANYQEKLSEFYYNRDENKKINPLNNLQITLLNKSASEILHQIKNADEDTAAAMLYALQNLNPIAISNPDASLKKELDKIKQNLAQYSDEWIQFRSLMLLEHLKVQSKQRKDNLLVEVLNPFDIASAENQLEELINNSRASLGISQDEGIMFSGHSTDNKKLQTVITHVGSVAAENKHRVEFGYLGDVIGGNQKDWLFGTYQYDDTIIGNGGNDILVAYDGNDTLTGGAGIDKLDGGDGFDTYIFNSVSEASSDRIIDSDGNGKITIAGKDVSTFSFKKLDNNIWIDRENGWRVVSVVSGDLYFFSTAGSGSFVVEKWQYMGGNQLGIVLQNVNDERPANGNKILLGDWRPQIDGSGKYKADQWDKRNANGGIINGVEEKDFNDIIQADNVDTTIKGLGGHDALSGGTGDDIIEGGDGFDMLLGGGGEDTIRGGDGNDFIYSHKKLMVSHRISPNDFVDISSLSSNYELLSASQNTLWSIHRDKRDGAIIPVNISDVSDDLGDTIFGGNGDDIVFASHHDDYIHGDGYRLSEDEKSIIYESGNDELTGNGGNDTIHGGLGNDKIRGDSSGTSPNLHGMDVLYGDEGDDELIGHGKDDILDGGEGDDYLHGDASINILDGQYHGNDVLHGGDGDDKLVGYGGHDTLDGGKGNDTLWGDSSNTNYRLDGQYHGNDTLYGGEGEDQLIGNGGSDVLEGGADNDILFGDVIAELLDGQYHGTDTLRGGAGNDRLTGHGKNDILDGGDGDDFLWGDAFSDYLAAEHHGNDTLYGGAGNDQITGHGANDILYGGTGDDIMWGDSNQFNDNGETSEPQLIGDDWLYGEEGNDRLHGGLGDDYLSGGTGTDILLGNMGDDTLYGNEDNDHLVGNGGNDTLFGGTGDDEIFGDENESQTKDWNQSFDDVLYGEDGNDILIGGSGSDVLYGGEGNDTLFAGTGIRQGSNQFTPSYFVGKDILYGGAGNDVLYGENGDMTLYGDEGMDRLISFAGNDQLYGGADSDYLESGKGTDYLYGGEESDVYRYKHHDGMTTINDLQGGSLILLDSLDNLRIESYENGIVVYNGIEGDKLYLVGHTMKPNDSSPTIAFALPEDANNPDKYISILDILRKQETDNNSGGSYTNQAPQQTHYLPNWTLTEDQTGMFVLPDNLFTDDLDHHLHYDVRMADGSSLPSWLAYHTDSTEMVARPDFEAAGVYNLKIVATDSGGLSTAIDWQIHVENQNRAPTVSGSLNAQDLTVGKDWQYRLPISFNDLDKDETAQLSYKLESVDGLPVPAWLRYDSASQSLSGKAEQAGSLNLRIVATDPHGESVAAPITLNIQAAPITPPPTQPSQPITPQPTQPVAGITKKGSGRNDDLLGGAGNDILQGFAGNDTLTGGQGNDQLEGGLGNDTYVFQRGDGQDRIIDQGGSKDIVKLNGFDINQLWFKRDGMRLEIHAIDSSDKIMIEQHYAFGKALMPNNPTALPTSKAAGAIEQIQLDNGRYIAAAQVDKLLQAMAAFAPQQSSPLSEREQMQQYLNQINVSSYWQ